MIRSVGIKRLRGIKAGSLENLAPLTVLVGPNSSGKSTVLDALLIGAHPVVGDAVGRAVRHRATAYNGARWLVWRGGDEGPAAVTTVGDETDAKRTCSITVSEQPRTADGVRHTHLKSSVGAGSIYPKDVTTRFEPDNNYDVVSDGDSRSVSLPSVSEVRFVEPWTAGIVAGLVELYSEAKRQGRGEAVLQVAKEVIPGFRGLEVLEEAGRSLLHVDRGNLSLQLGVEGDGVQSLLRLAIEFSARPRGVVLVEEPEAHQHPRSLVATANVIAAAVARGIQVVFSTHSLELIDDVTSAMRSINQELEKMCVISLRLEEGRLVSSRLEGAQVALAREKIELELR